MKPRWPGVLIAWVFAAAACAAPVRLPRPPAERWVATWATAPQLTEPRNMPPEPGLGGNTLRQALRVSIGGSRLRVHYSNEYGRSPMEIRAAQLARYSGSGAIEAASSQPLTFGGQTGVSIPAGEVAVSDPLGYELEPMADLALTTWFGEVPGDLTGHPGSRMTSYIQSGDAVSAPSLAAGVPTEHWYAMTGIDVVAPDAAAVAILGNSITDGRGSTTNGNDRWPDMLSRRLRANPATSRVAVLNLGTGGNCVLRACLGPAGLERYRRDVLDQAGVRWVIVLEGVNDIGGARGPAASDSTARALIVAYQQMIRQARARGLRIYGATILPFGGSGYSSPDHEAARTTVNTWIRTSGAFDAVIDFDAALRDPADPTRLRPDADTGDHLHPNAEGYRLMGEAVDLALFGVGGPGRAAVPAQRSPRQRSPINDGWRFTLGDPPGNVVSLLYDVRPEVRDERDDRPADARPQEAEQRAATAPGVVKPWILPTGNDFIRDPAKRLARPEGNRGGEVAYVQPDFDDGSWRQVSLPHDWAIEGPFITTGGGGGMGRLPSAGIGWYRKRLDIPVSDGSRSIFLDVDGAMSYATVWLNGRLVGGWPYGYASWRVDLTPYVIPGGTNLLAIRLDNPPGSSRWYPGGGLYRNVWLTKTSPLHVGQWGTFVTTPQVSASSATIDLQVTVDNDSQGPATVTVATEIFALDAGGSREGDVVATIAPVSATIPAGSNTVVHGTGTIANPRLWGPPPSQRPNRYVAVTSVTHGGRLSDSYETFFGIRDIRFDPDRGVIVNGERFRIRGVNQHHDLGALGAAFNVRAAERQLEILRDMGANAIRTAHNPPAPELLELTDRMGFLVLDEIFDAWERRKTPLDFHLIFPDWHEPDIRAFVRRDRNHPSVFAWSTGNEVGEQYTGEEGAALAKRLADIVREEDPTRPTTASMNYARPDMPFAAATDFITLNYQGEGIRDAPEYAGLEGIRTPPLYPSFHAAFPEKLILSSETAAALSSRGEYLFPVTSGSSAPVKDGAGGDPATRQVSAYELYTAPFGSSADKVFASLDRHPYVAGEFVWSGWDYLGEPTPYHSSRSSYFGIIDLAGFPKDRFYLYQSQWRPDLPMAHILPHWTWPERVGQVTSVHVFTSGDEGELFLNGRSLGRRTKGDYEYRLRWDDVVYEPGTLEVVTYRKGARWAADTMRTAAAPASLEVRPDRSGIRADGYDLSFVTVRVLDEHGVLVPRAKNRIRFDIEGPGEIVATDNGDPTSFEPFQAHERAAFNGLCLVIVRAKVQAGRIVLTASSAGLRDGVTVITSGGDSPAPTH